MAMLNPTQFDNDSTLKKVQLYYRRGKGKFLPHLINRLQFNYLCKLYFKPKFPPHLDIEPTMLCNMKCPMCFQQHMAIPSEGFLDFELYKKIVDEGAKNHLYSIRLCHRGEPLLHPKIVDMVKYAKEKGIKEVFTLTNGMLLNEDLIRRLYAAGLDWLQLSIDGVYENYENIRQPAKFKDIYGKVKLLHKIREEEKRLRPIIWIQSIWSAVKHDPKQFIDLFSPYVDKIAFHVDFDYEHRFKRDPDFVCYRLWHRMMIMADGIVPMCNSDFLKDEIVGDVRCQTVKEVWNGEKLERIRKLNLEKRRFELMPCAKCNWGNLRENKELIINGKKQKVMTNIAPEEYKKDLQDLDITLPAHRRC
ncbi:MAG: hypothetical protein A2987_00285 [Omnitrophica bacterium RIFCSPLOWO2_01_FULL_45_10]|nr:MAG: hypothetical protein A2987_00285 [Omnitrophica bacterium RIFCSPLOWO2_01_FULL_45_10]